MLTKQFFLGCALWGYKPWVGELFPTGSRPSDFLRLYGERFTAVEGNTTFYSVPDVATIARWVADTPPGFQFCPKLPQTLTHAGALTGAIAEASRFIRHMQGLGDRLGPLLVQLPPRYSPTQFQDLAQFLTEIARLNAELAVEVRHLGWFEAPHSDRLGDLLTQLGVGRVLLDTRPVYEVPDDPQVGAERKKPRVPVTLQTTSDFTIIRYISHPTWSMNLSFVPTWLPHIQTALQSGRRVYCFVHCPIEARSPGNARELQTWLERQGVELPPLPWTELQEPPQQLSLHF